TAPRLARPHGAAVRLERLSPSLSGGAGIAVRGGGLRSEERRVGKEGSNLFLRLILHHGNLFLIVQLHFSKLFLILKSVVNHTSRGSISTSTLPSIKLRKCSSKIITSILSFISGRLATKSNQI